MEKDQPNKAKNTINFMCVILRKSTTNKINTQVFLKVGVLGVPQSVKQTYRSRSTFV